MNHIEERTMIRLSAAVVLAALLWAPQAIAENPRIAIAPMQVEGEGLAQDQVALDNYLEGQMQQAKTISPIARAEAADAWKKASLIPIGGADQTVAVAAGKLLKADKVVWGKLANVGGKLTFWLKMVNTGSGELLFSKTYATGSSDEAAKKEFERNYILIAKELVATVTGQNAGEIDLTITAVCAAGVASLDKSGPSDVYVSVSVGDEIVGITSVKQNKSNPAWNESIGCKYRGEKIKFAFFDRDITKDEYIGSCALDGPTDGTYDIVFRFQGQEKKRGTFTVKFLQKKFEAVEKGKKD
jgi:hypothetical protein